MSSDAIPTRRVSANASKVIEELARRRKTSLVLPEDENWLKKITPYPPQLLKHMVANRVLYRLGRGRYVIAPPATSMPLQAATAEQMVDISLSPYGEYYIGFLSAMIHSRLRSEE